ncbi:MAG TPA: GspE/PulE family protein [Actinomycetota bacterium]|nr:GspE/PulE family protein [Actinomycetota bacterium]
MRAPRKAAPGRRDPRAPKRFGELLVARGTLSQRQLDDALAQQQECRERLGQILLTSGLFDEREVAHALAEHLDLPFADLRREQPNPDCAGLVPAETAKRWLVLPLAADDASIRVAVADPSDEVVEEIRRTTDRSVIVSVAAPSDIRRALINAYRTLGSLNEHIAAFEDNGTEEDRIVRLTVREDQEDAPVVQAVDLIIRQGVEDRASDIHIEPRDEHLVIRFRVDGVLHEATTLPRAMGRAVSSRIKVMAGMNIVDRRRPQDGQIATRVNGRELDIRVSTTPTFWGEKIVLRLLDKERPLFRLGELGMPADTYSEFLNLIRSPFGMVLCAGPTGSGKTTTLYGSLAELDKEHRNVMTIEDPIEYVFPGINQIQINERAGVTFAGGLRAILRQDPDVILVGEIRDVETARIAVQSSLSGHLVLSSVHATDAASALHRFLDMGIEAFLVASSVLGVIGQRLVRRVCGACRARYEPTQEELHFFEQVGGDVPEAFWCGEGCNLCNDTGFEDRIGVYEMLVVTDEIRALMLENATRNRLRACAIEQGMVPLAQQAARLVGSGTTTIAELLRTIYKL